MAVSLVVAAVAFPPLLLVSGCLSRELLIGFVDSGFGFWGFSDSVVIGFFAAVAVVLAYVASRAIYTHLRWQTVVDNDQFCRNCGYDLTGNVSGRCPECGEPLRGETPTPE